MRYIILLSIFLLASCAGGNSSPAAPIVTELGDSIPTGAITINTVAITPVLVPYRQSYSIVFTVDSTHAGSQNIITGLKYHHSHWDTDTILSNQNITVLNGVHQYSIVLGFNLWDYGYDGRPSTVDLTYTATINGVEYVTIVTLQGRFVSVPG